MALVIDRPQTSDTQATAPINEERPASRPEPGVARSTPSDTPQSPVGFGRSFVLATAMAITVIVTATVSVWWLYRGEFWPGVGLAAYLAFWFAPAAGLIGGGTYWTTKNPLH